MGKARVKCYGHERTLPSTKTGGLLSPLRFAALLACSRATRQFSASKMMNSRLRLCGSLGKAQELVGKHVAAMTSLVDELIAERRQAARRDSNRDPH